MVLTHNLKILPKYFEAVQRGFKNFELRKNDRNYTLGDVLVLKEYDGVNYTGRSITKVITYIFVGGQYGLEEGFVILGLGGEYKGV